MTTEERFNAAVEVIRGLPKNGSFQPSHELQLKFYAYYKQATQGSTEECKVPKPRFWDIVGNAKWDAWMKLGNMSKQEAMEKYVEELVKVFLAGGSTGPNPGCPPVFNCCTHCLFVYFVLLGNVVALVLSGCFVCSSCVAKAEPFSFCMHPLLLFHMIFSFLLVFCYFCFASFAGC